MDGCQHQQKRQQDGGSVLKARGTGLAGASEGMVGQDSLPSLVKGQRKSQLSNPDLTRKRRIRDVRRALPELTGRYPGLYEVYLECTRNVCHYQAALESHELSLITEK